MIGEGGMGVVHLARDLRLGRRVAIKFLQSQQPELTQRFLTHLPGPFTLDDAHNWVSEGAPAAFAAATGGYG